MVPPHVTLAQLDSTVQSRQQLFQNFAQQVNIAQLAAPSSRVVTQVLSALQDLERCRIAHLVSTAQEELISTSSASLELTAHQEAEEKFHAHQVCMVLVTQTTSMSNRLV